MFFFELMMVQPECIVVDILVWTKVVDRPTLLSIGPLQTWQNKSHAVIQNKIYCFSI